MREIRILKLRQDPGLVEWDGGAFCESSDLVSATVTLQVAAGNAAGYQVASYGKTGLLLGSGAQKYTRSVGYDLKSTT